MYAMDNESRISPRIRLFNSLIEGIRCDGMSLIRALQRRFRSDPHINLSIRAHRKPISEHLVCKSVSEERCYPTYEALRYLFTLFRIRARLRPA